MLHKVTSVSGRESPASNPTAIEPNVGCSEIAKKDHIRHFMPNIKTLKLTCCIPKIQVED